jgi:hypothetical protein
VSFDFVGKKRMEEVHGKGGMEVEHGILKGIGFN